MGGLKSNERRARLAILLIWIVLAMEIVNLVSSCMQLDLLQTVASGGDVPAEAGEANDNREAAAGRIYLLAYAISAITFILWFRRAYYNLHQKAAPLALPEGWAAGCWFVPIVNLFRPYQIMKEMYVETKKLLDGHGFRERVAYTTRYLDWWWTLWVMSAVVGNVIFKFATRNATTVEDYILVTVAQIIVGILGIPLALVTVKVIKDYARMEPLLREIGEEEETRTPGERVTG
jgi:hypothetical protein